jgi:Predicted nucleotide-binding protein containing TIR-like domain
LSKDLFKQINNAVLDLQSADFQSYTDPLKRLGRFLRHSDLALVNETLTGSLDLDAFLEKSNRTQGSLIGSAQLKWPDDDSEILGLKLLLIFKFCDEMGYIENFGHTFFWSNNNKIMASVRAVVSQLIIPFIRDYKTFVESEGDLVSKIVRPLTKKVFIVHGHDEAARETVARFLTSIGFEPIILHEQASRGRTVIEKIEANADVGFAVVLLTPDDEGRNKGQTDFEPRVRQNVLLELGYFMSHLGRHKVCALVKGSVTIPSDFAGVVWEEMDKNGGWKIKLAKELEAAGHTVDASKLLS